MCDEFDLGIGIAIIPGEQTEGKQAHRVGRRSKAMSILMQRYFGIESTR